MDTACNVLNDKQVIQIDPVGFPFSQRILPQETNLSPETPICNSDYG